MNKNIVRKLNEEELLEKLNRAFEYLPLSIANGQARRQIKEMIQSYAEHQEIIASYIDIVIDLYEQLEKKMLTVNEEFVKIYTDMINEDPHQCTRENLIGMLREAGVKVIVE